MTALALFRAVMANTDDIDAAVNAVYELGRVGPRHAMSPKSLAANAIIAQVAEKHGCRADQIRSRSRVQALVDARWECARRMRDELAMSYPAIGAKLCMHHTSVMHAVGSMA